MLGRLPSRYRLAIWIAGLLTFTVAGAWLALTTPLPMVWSSGAVVGAVLGILAVAAYLHALEGTADRRPAARGR